MTYVNPATAAELATDTLRHNPSNTANALLNTPHAATVSVATIEALRDTCRIESDEHGDVNESDVQTLFWRTRILDGTGQQHLRVSVRPMQANSVAVDRLSDGTSRTHTGIHFDHHCTAGHFKNVTAVEKAAAYEGVWPLSEETLRRASLMNVPLLPSLKGFMDLSLARRVAGSNLDMMSKQQGITVRWVVTQQLSDLQLHALRGRRDDVEALWLTVARGTTARLEIPTITAAMRA